MKYSFLVRTLSFLCIACLSLEALGCADLKEVSNINDVKGKRILVSAKDGTVYELEKFWTIEVNGDISGFGIARKEYYQRFGGLQIQSAFTEFTFQGAIPANSIASIRYEVTNYTAPLIVIGALSAALYIIIRWGENPHFVDFDLQNISLR